MKYLAIGFLLLAAFLNAGASPKGGTDTAAAVPTEDNRPDGAIAGVLAVALVALQLRRRQKSLQNPRQLN